MGQPKIKQALPHRVPFVCVGVQLLDTGGRWDEGHLEDTDGGRNPAMQAILVLCEFVKGDTPISSKAAFGLAGFPVSG